MSIVNLFNYLCISKAMRASYPIKRIWSSLFFITKIQVSEMAEAYELLMQKQVNGSSVKSSLTDFECAVSDFDYPEEEAFSVTSQTWEEEDGEDVYLPSVMRIKSYEVKVTFEYKTSIDAYYNLRDYLTGRDGYGTRLKLYFPYYNYGRQDCYVTKMKNEFKHVSDVGVVGEIEVTFKVASPTEEITLSI